MVAYCEAYDELVNPVAPDGGEEHCPMCQTPVLDKGVDL